MRLDQTLSFLLPTLILGSETNQLIVRRSYRLVLPPLIIATNSVMDEICPDRHLWVPRAIGQEVLAEYHSSNVLESYRLIDGFCQSYMNQIHMLCYAAVNYWPLDLVLHIMRDTPIKLVHLMCTAPRIATRATFQIVDWLSKHWPHWLAWMNYAALNRRFDMLLAALQCRDISPKNLDSIAMHYQPANMDEVNSLEIIINRLVPFMTPLGCHCTAIWLSKIGLSNLCRPLLCRLMRTAGDGFTLRFQALDWGFKMFRSMVLGEDLLSGSTQMVSREFRRDPEGANLLLFRLIHDELLAEYQLIGAAEMEHESSPLDDYILDVKTHPLSMRLMAMGANINWIFAKAMQTFHIPMLHYLFWSYGRNHFADQVNESTEWLSNTKNDVFWFPFYTSVFKSINHHHLRSLDLTIEFILKGKTALSLDHYYRLDTIANVYSTPPCCWFHHLTMYNPVYATGDMVHVGYGIRRQTDSLETLFEVLGVHCDDDSGVADDDDISLYF